MTDPKTDSPAYQMVTLAYRHTIHGSWSRLNSGLFAVLSAAVRVGVTFDVDDLDRFPGGGHWLGAAETRERLYWSACEADNVTAAVAIAKSLRRQEYKWEPHDGDSVEMKRVHVGATLYLDGLYWGVNSFSDDGLHVNMTRQQRGNDSPEVKQQRKRMSFDEMEAIRKERTTAKREDAKARKAEREKAREAAT